MTEVLSIKITDGMDVHTAIQNECDIRLAQGKELKAMTLAATAPPIIMLVFQPPVTTVSVTSTVQG